MMDDDAHAMHLERVRQLGSFLEGRRGELGISQREMARRTGIAQSQLSRLESGTYDLDLGLRYLPALSKGYEIELFGILERLFPGLDEHGPSSDVLSVELRPTRAFEKTVASVNENIAALRAEMGAKIEALKANQEATAQGVSQALAAFMTASKDFNAMREALVSMSTSRLGTIPAPQPIDVEAQEPKPRPLAKGSRGD